MLPVRSFPSVRLPFESRVFERVLRKYFTIYCFVGVLIRATMAGREALNMKLPPIQSTAGAVPIRNEKGEMSAMRLAICYLASGSTIIWRSSISYNSVARTIQEDIVLYRIVM